MEWWKPITTGGSLSCDSCPEVVRLRAECAQLEKEVAELQDEMLKAVATIAAEVKRPDISAELYNDMGEQWTKAVKDARRWRDVAAGLYCHLPWGTSEGAVNARAKYDEAVSDGWV